MKNIIFLIPLFFCLVACNNYKIEDLYGTWSSEKLAFTFNKDKTMQYLQAGVEQNGRYRIFGNSIELINSEDKVIGTLAIKSLRNDSLVVDMLSISSNLQTLVRKK
jgi:hypothetical protein